ncbi:MAG TPA: MFS transporter [Solirubrobacteraceae bacterium]|nr:MFS transporter [Solirubrobacteraceae bacterium]
MSKKNLVLAAMVFAVAMTFIDQTIVAIGIPNIEKELGITANQSQWVINAYLLALSALFAFGGKLADVVGRRRMCVIGVIGFAVASLCCGLTPKGDAAAAWIIAFRAIQGVFAALMFPAAVGIIVAVFPKQERGKAMAAFFGITGGLTSVGPIAGGFLVQWTWRSIFWINIPVAIIALILIRMSKPDNTRYPSGIDVRGAGLVTAAMALLVLGLQQSSQWGWNSAGTVGCIVAGLIVGLAFLAWELRIEEPLLNLRIFADRGFGAENAVLALMSVVFVPFFFFASVYSQAALGKSASQAGLYILYFFIGFVILAQIGGRILDRSGPWVPVVGGPIISAVGFYLLAGKLTDLNLGAQSFYIAVAGGGIGLMLGAASTDAVNRAPRSGYSEVTGITQTSRNFGATLGLAILGAILLSREKINVASGLVKAGVPAPAAHQAAASIGTRAGAAHSAAGQSKQVTHAVQLAFAHSTQTIFYIMAGVMAATFLVALIWLPRTPATQAGEEAVPLDRGDIEPAVAVK